MFGRMHVQKTPGFCRKIFHCLFGYMSRMVVKNGTLREAAVLDHQKDPVQFAINAFTVPARNPAWRIRLDRLPICNSIPDLLQ